MKPSTALIDDAKMVGVGLESDMTSKSICEAIVAKLKEKGFTDNAKVRIKGVTVTIIRIDVVDPGLDSQVNVYYWTQPPRDSSNHRTRPNHMSAGQMVSLGEVMS